MIHFFPKKTTWKEGKNFTDPFRYTPHPLVISAAESVITDLDRRIKDGALPADVCKGFREGKMLGVLVCESGTPEQDPIYLAGFSGSVGGCSMIEGFVPPIYDLMDPDGHYKRMEAEITDLNNLIKELQNASEYHEYFRMLWTAESVRDSELRQMREQMEASRKDRAQRRANGCDPNTLNKESQFEKAEFRRLKQTHEAKIKEINNNILDFNNIIDKYKKQRASMSDDLQEWIFKNYIVHNFLGEEASVYDIFTSQGLTPPGGTGDCAAPKLLEYAYRTGLKPLAMGEFWYGTSPDTAVRTHGHFYPSCTSKCNPLLGYMLKGLNLDINCNRCNIPPVIIHEDNTIIAVSKPSGMPSVPGLDGRISAQEWLEKKYEDSPIYPVHRLDMDTSGVLVFARNSEAAVRLRRQFEEHTVSKTYLARLCPQDPALPASNLLPGATGSINLALNADYDERPRQKVDMHHGKDATTNYDVLSENPDGTIDIAFHPVTGRTHQLRVHSAHHLGLGRPILGDMLYGGQGKSTPKRLHLHAQRITFIHPETGQKISIDTSLNRF